MRFRGVHPISARGLGLVLLILAILPVQAHPVPPLAGTYSNLTYIEGEGDVTGMEITLIPSGTAEAYVYHAVIQLAEGVPDAPQLVPVKVDGASVVFSFTYPGAGPVTFTGKISATGLVGNLKGPHLAEAAYQLPRKRGFWQAASSK